MALIIWPLLLSIPIFHIQASPVSPASLTPYITNIVPSCARSCLQSFISYNYPTQVCTAQNFNCLCITPTTTSYTLGEAALACVYSACSEQVDNVNGVYDLCNKIPGAQTNFHTSLVASLLDPSATTSAERRRSSTTSASSSTTSTSSSSSSKTLSTTKKSTTSSSTTSSHSSSSTSSTSTTDKPQSTKQEAPSEGSTLPPVVAPSASSTSESSSTLSKPQIAGIVVAAIGVAALSFGFCFFFICYRRRKSNKERRESDTSLIGDKLLNSQDSSPDLSRGESRYPIQQNRPRSDNKPPLRVVTPSQRGWSEWRNTAESNPHGIGLALGPETPQQSSRDGPSPMTPASFGTNSQLLPDKPHNTLASTAPHRLSKRYSRSLQPPLPTYAPEKTPPMSGPRFPSSMDTSQIHLQGNTRSMSDPFYNDQHSPLFEGYRGVPYTPWANPPASLKRPRSVLHSQKVGAQPTIIEESTSSVPVIDLQNMPPPGRAWNAKQPLRKKSESSSRYDRSVRSSNGSGTSFEDIDDDPSLPKTVLSPVTEVYSPPRQLVTPPLPVKSVRRDSHIINRARPIPRSRQSGEPESPNPSIEVQDRDVTHTAKYKILVSPGLQSLEGSLPSTPRTPIAGGTFSRHDERLPPLAR